MEDQRYHKLEDFVLSDIFKNYVLGKDKAAQDFWTAWLAAHPGQREEFERAVDILKLLLNPKKQKTLTDKNQELKSLLEKLDRSDSKRISFKSNFVWKAAALLIIAISIGVLWNLFLSNRGINNNTVSEVIVPIGEKSQIILPDGTHVWINSGSRFTYPLKFGITNREVFLDGEAYFDVTKRKDRMPFVVNTNDIKVKVLGTAFNVKNYKSDKTVETTVVRGLIQVERVSDSGNQVLLNPNEKAIYLKEVQESNVPKVLNKNNNLAEKTSTTDIVVMKTNPEVVTSWKDQLLVFNDETLEDMSVKMERWYNIKIHISDTDLKKERFNGKFVHNETIYQVLEAIKLTTPIKYKVKDNEIIVTRK